MTSTKREAIVRSFKYIPKVRVEESIANAPRIMDHGSAV
jgi:hypothetical protein